MSRQLRVALAYRPIFEPESVPIESIGDALPAVPPSRLTPEALRERFAATIDWTIERLEDPRRSDRAGDPRQAAVLVPLVMRDDEITVLLTRRTAHLTDHAGQISFPGGRCEPTDLDSVDTALREAWEEVGLDRSRVEVLGVMPQYTTGTGYIVTPVVGLVAPPFTLSPADDEVAEVFEVPLAFLADPAHHQVRLFRWEGGQRRFFAMPYRAAANAPEYFIWGATAAMLRNFYRFLVA